MDITGMLAIGNGEKCPYCDMINEENIDYLKHMISKHKEELDKALFKGE